MEGAIALFLLPSSPSTTLGISVVNHRGSSTGLTNSGDSGAKIRPQQRGSAATLSTISANSQSTSCHVPDKDITDTRNGGFGMAGRRMLRTTAPKWAQKWAVCAPAAFEFALTGTQTSRAQSMCHIQPNTGLAITGVVIACEVTKLATTLAVVMLSLAAS